MRLQLFKIFLAILLINSVNLAQRLLKVTVDVGGKEDVLSYVTKSGNTFVSSKELSDVLSANYYYNQEAAKLEIKFPEYTIKFTAKNQFIVITTRSSNSQNIFQLPVSTLLINDDVFIPIGYSIDYLSLCYGKGMVYENKSKRLTITNKQFASESYIAENLNAGIPVQNDDGLKLQGKSVDSKYDVYGISIEEKANGTLIRLNTSRKINIPRYSIGNNTLYVFFSNTRVAPDIAKNIKPTGLVKKIKRTIVSSKNIQLEFELKQGYTTSEAFQDVESNDIMITIHSKFIENQTSKAEDIKSKWIFDTIVIDAGHGGKDPGAIGVTGVREKVINLGIALKLGNLIENALPSVKVVYTRKDDKFIELYKRGKIANEAGGKLFISIHCNSMPGSNSATRGFEVYLLRPGRTKEAIDISEFENSVIKYEDNPHRYQKLTDENFILVSMAHSQSMRYSEKFSDILNQEWNKEVGIPSLGIKQAGFYVLVGASMPNVLIESGFLSNRRDEAYLASSSGQMDIAKAIFAAVQKYKDYYDREMEVSSGIEGGK